MNEVQAIKSKADINRMKRSLHGRDQLLFTLGINLGLRISDLLKLRVRDVVGRDYLDFTEQKTGKRKRLTFNKSVKQAVRVLAGNQPPTAYLFANPRTGKPLSRVQAYRILNDAADRAGLLTKYGAIGCHSLRKTFGFHAYQGGADITLLMAVFNHSSVAQTLRYIGVTADDIACVYEGVNL